MADIKSKLLARLTESGTPERCGVVMPDGEIVEIENIHESPMQGFHMEPETFLGRVRAGATATWHTHPGKDPNLSHEDLAGFRQWPQLTHHIIGLRDKEPTVHSFKVVEDGIVVRA